VLVFFFTCHLMACSYWGMVRDTCPTVFEHYNEGRTEDPFCPDSLRAMPQLSKVKFQVYAEQYSMAFYWALWSVMGNGNGVQPSMKSYIFTSAMLMVGMVAFSTIIGSMSALMTNSDAEQLERQKELDFVNRYLIARRVKPELQRQITDYYEYIWDTGNTPYHKRLLDQLPSVLGARLRVNLRRTLIEKVPMFKHCRAGTILELLERLEPLAAVQNEFVVHMGDLAKCMFFVEHGRLACIIKTAAGSWLEVAQVGRWVGR
jgi:hypothetical protein